MVRVLLLKVGWAKLGGRSIALNLQYRVAWCDIYVKAMQKTLGFSAYCGGGCVVGGW